jgi:hypothetical protein
MPVYPGALISRFHSPIFVLATKRLKLVKNRPFSQLSWVEGKAPMEYDDIIAGFRAITATDFDYKNVDARGFERLTELTDSLMIIPAGLREKAIPEMFDIMERLPDADLGSPGPLVHTLEALPRYEDELVRSVRPTAILSIRLDGKQGPQLRSKWRYS